MPRRWFVVAAVSLLSSLIPFTAAGAADAAGSPRLKLSTERVVIFKDGHGLVVKAGVTTADADGRAFTADVPDGAILGCFWAIGQDKKVLGMRAEWNETKEVRDKETPAVTVAELLRANVGKAVSLELTDKTDKGTPLARDGQVIEMLELPPEVAPKVGASRHADDLASTAGPIVYTTMIHDGVAASGSFTAEAIAAGGTLVRELEPRGGEYVVISQEAGRRIVLPGSVSGGKDFATSVTRGEEILTRSKRLSFDFGKDEAGKQVSLTLFYFTAGLRWIPTYRVSGELKDKAGLALQGEILNDVTDIDHAALDLVVGVPNFRFKDTLSPLTLEQTLRRVAIESLNAGNNAYNGQSQMLNANFDNNRIMAAPGLAAAGEAPAPELANATGEQDLFVYGLKDFSLKKGARATVPLWEQTADLRHLYTYDIRARRNRISGGLLDETAADPNAAQSPLHVSVNQVWHQLELSNTGAVPWTTGAALMLRGSLPIGQDLLTYTPPTSKALLPVTVAVDLRGTHDDQELERKPNALHFDNAEFMQIWKKGTITVTSYRKEKSDMRITVSTGGKVAAASDDGKIKVNDFRAADWDEPSYMRVNNHSDVVWEFTIDPGTTKTITYETTFFVR
jgi:hypothetical protein